MDDKDIDVGQNPEEGSGLSRRAFLKGGGVLAGAAVLAGTGLGLTACTSDDGGGTTNGATTSAPGYEVYDAEVLVIGAGMGAMFAAFEAHTKGATVMMVDKGPYEFGGAVGMNWDQELAWPSVPAPEYVAYPGQLDNQKLGKKVFDFVGTTPEAVDQRLIWVRLGGTTWNRLPPNGELENLLPTGMGGYMLAQRGFSRHIQDTLKALDIKIIDQTMITDLFLSDGKCVGAVGVHTPTGTYRVFRAKGTIAATGGACQMYGWLRTHPISMNSPDNTGDVDAAAYRRGCKVMSSEMFALDMISVFPPSLGASFNSGIGADGNHLQYVCDKDGNFIMREHVGYDVSGAFRDAILAGKGGPDGELYIDLTSDDSVTESKLRPTYARNIQLWKEQFGIDVRAAGFKIPVKLEAFEHGGNPMTDDNLMTEIPGFFDTRGYGAGPSALGAQMTYGAFGGQCVAEYAKSAEIGAVDWADAVAEFNRLEEIRTREVEGGLRPQKIRHAIQDAFYVAHEPGSDGERLQTCITELERIKTEDLPKMVVTNKTKVFNVEWKQAIENYNILTLAEASTKAGLMREETRGTFYRADFPEQDDANWAVNIAAKLVDGAMVLEKVPQVTL